MASARARKLALAADTFGGRVMTIPAAPNTSQGAESHKLARADALCKHNFTERESSPASRSSAVCLIPGVTRRAAAQAQAPAVPSSNCCVEETERHASSARVPTSRTAAQTFGV